MNRRLATASILACLALPGPLAPARLADPPCEFDHVDRIVAIGDVHGAYDRFVEILRAAGVVDARQRWAGGRTHLVQLGDVVDRGPDSRKVLDLLQQLERDAPRTGGRVHALIGNHEAMRLMGDFRYTTAGEYAAFATSASEDLRAQVAQSAAPDVRDRLIGETPLGKIEMIQAFGPMEPYGSFIRRLNAVEVINGVLFMHGGLSAAVASLRCADINARVRKELSADLDKTKKAPEQTLAAGEDGPLWYRGLATEPETFAPHVDEILAAAHARAIVVGHTVRADCRVGVRFGGRVFVIDTGMQPAYVPFGRPSAIEFTGAKVTAIYLDRRDTLRDTSSSGQ